MKNDCIILIGPSAVGKTVVGEIISKKTGLKWIDSDIFLHNKLKFQKKEVYELTELQRKKEIEYNIFENLIKKHKNFVFSTCSGLFIEQKPELLQKIEKNLLNCKNVFLLLPSSNILISKEVLEKRLKNRKLEYALSSIEKQMSYFYKISKKTIYTQNMTPEMVAIKVLSATKLAK